MTIDVIIPCYNAHKTLGRALSSIAMQDIADKLNVTLVDDCSPDGGYHKFVEMFSPLLNIEEVTLQENGGPAVARQTGLDETDGDFVVFMDADDTFVGSAALRLMYEAITQNNMDVVTGQFIEELEDGRFVTHGHNMVWVFAKMYRRSFLDRFLIRFNDTRANEDTGFNSVVGALTKNILHIPQVVYQWHYSESTITRKDNAIYTWASGHRGYIENMIWATKEMERRSINKEIIRRHIVSTLCKLYFFHEDVIAHARDEAKGSWEWIVRFYRECYLPIRDYVPSPYLHEIYVEEHNRHKVTTIPQGSFRDFLHDLQATAEAIDEAERSEADGNNCTASI
jgi:glycosyltransferase involved in cell wall biosynthesis